MRIGTARLGGIFCYLGLITSATLGGETNPIIRNDGAIRLNSTNASVYDRRGWAHGTSGELDKAISDFNQAICLNPKDAVAYCLRGKAYEEKGDLGNALNDLNESIRLNPNDPLAHNNRGFIHSQNGNLNDALRDLNDAIRFDPKFDLAYANRGHTYSKQGEFHKAIIDFNEAIRLNPKEGRYHNSLAWLLATCPEASLRDGARAVEAAKTACELVKWKTWYCVGTLGAAYAEMGDFDRAIAYQKQALSMTGPSDQDRAEAEGRLTLYHQLKAYHESLK